MKRLISVCVLLALAPMAFAAADYRWTGAGRANDWTDEENYDPEGVPAAGDNLIIPTNTTIRLVSTDMASWEVADRLDYIRPETETSFIEVNVPAGEEALLKCGISWNHADYRSNDKGGLIKTGDGWLQLMKNNGQRTYYTSITVDAGVLRAPTNVTSSGLFQFDRLNVKAGSTFYLATGWQNSAHPVSVCRQLTGTGLVTNDTTYTWGELFEIESSLNSEFAGTLGGRIRLNVKAKLSLTGTNNTIEAKNDGVRVANNTGRFLNGPTVSFVKLGRRDEPSSLGMGDLLATSRATGDDMSGGFRYLGTGEVEPSDKNLTLCAKTDYPSFFDAGEHGGLTFAGTLAPSSSTTQDFTFILMGENTNECTIAGPVVDVTNDNGTFSISNIVKRGSGIWHFADNAKRTWSGALTVESGTVRFDSYAPIGEVCSLGTAANAEPYPVILKGGVLEYTGNAPLETAGRPIAVDGEAQIRNASAEVMSLAGVTAADSDATVVLDASAGETNRFASLRGSVSFRKTGLGTTVLSGEQSFAGDLSVEAGEMLVTVPRYEWYEVTFRHTISNQQIFYVSEFGLYDKDGRRQNGDLRCLDGVAFADLKRGETTWNKDYVYNNYDPFDNMFDDTGAPWHAYQKGTGTPDPAVPESWVKFVMRLGEDAHLVTSFDTVVGASPKNNGNGGKRSVNDYVLRASVDGVTWDVICSTNKLYEQLKGVSYQWFFNEEVYDAGDAKVHTTGCPIPARPESLPDMLSNCRVSVADGAVLRVRDEDEVTLSKLRVSAIGAGTLMNVNLAEAGSIDVTDIPAGVSEFDLPITFADVEDEMIDRIANWTLTVNGAETSKWTMSVADGRIHLAKKGLILILR